MMRSMRLRFAVASLTLAFAACGSALAAGSGPAAASSGGGGGVWIQTMDSCKQALGGAAYVVSGSGGSITGYFTEVVWDGIPATTPGGGGPNLGAHAVQLVD